MITKLRRSDNAAFGFLKRSYGGTVHLAVVGDRKEVQRMVVCDPDIVDFEIPNVTLCVFKVFIHKCLFAFSAVLNDCVGDRINMAAERS